MEFKAITWAGNLYQKFEAMCLEVEEVMYQDTVKYLENQVQTVGAGVKKLYSEVMEDFSPPSCIDPVKVAAADLSLNSYSHTGITKKTKQIIRGDQKELKTKKIDDHEAIAEKNACKPSFSELDGVVQSRISGGDLCLIGCSELSSGHRKSGGLYRRPVAGGKGSRNRGLTSKMSGSSTPLSWNPSRISSFCEIRSGVLPDSVKEYNSLQASVGNRLTDEGVCSSTAVCDSPAPDAILSCETVTREQDDLKSAATPGLSSGSIDLGANNETPHLESTIDSITSAFGGRSDSDVKDVVSIVDEPELEIVERLDESQFEETCVMVEGNNVDATSQKEEKHKSYKKKIRQVFSSKMGLTRKQEYKKLAAEYNIEAPKLERAASLKSICCEELSPVKQQAPCNPDTEWELL